MTLHAVFLANGTSLDFRGVLEAGDPSTAFDRFYDIALAALERYNRAKTVSITNNERCFLTPTIKPMLGRKDSLLHSGRIEEASAIATRVGKAIAKFNSTELLHADNRTGIKELWTKVRKLTKEEDTRVSCSITANELNKYFSMCSHDPLCTPTSTKLSACSEMLAFTE